MTAIIPRNDYVLVQPDEPQTMHRGIHLPPNLDLSGITRGTVISTGPGRLLDNGTRVGSGLNPGDRVEYYPEGTVPVHADGTKFLLVSELSILAVVTGEPIDVEMRFDETNASTA